ncbi:MAG: hypothetical protein ACE368_09285 [Paracoccaceae bacterium]
MAWLDNFYGCWVEQRIDKVIWNTTIYVLGATVFGITTAAVLAWLVERSDMPGKTWIYAGVPLGIAVPGILHAIAWVLLLSPRSGFVNRAWMDMTGTREPLFDIYTMGGLIFAEGLRLVPVAFLMLVPLMRSMDPSLEEAAAASGASPMRAARRVDGADCFSAIQHLRTDHRDRELRGAGHPGDAGEPACLQHARVQPDRQHRHDPGLPGNRRDAAVVRPGGRAGDLVLLPAPRAPFRARLVSRGKGGDYPGRCSLAAGASRRLASRFCSCSSRSCFRFSSCFTCRF